MFATFEGAVAMDALACGYSKKGQGIAKAKNAKSWGNAVAKYYSK